MMASNEALDSSPESVSDGQEETQPVSGDLVISSLPDEIWLKVLHLLTSWELCRVSLVCKELLRLTRDPSLWTEITLLGDAVAGTDTVSTLFRQVESSEK